MPDSPPPNDTAEEAAVPDAEDNAPALTVLGSDDAAVCADGACAL